MSESDLTRRGFLQGAGAAAALTVTGLDLAGCTMRKAKQKGVKATAWVDSVCPYCGVGCGLRVGTANGKVVSVEGMKEHPVNQGRLCLLGRTLVGTLDTPDRLRHPMRRQGSEFTRVTWERALGSAAGKIREVIQKHGPDAFALYVSASEYIEEYYIYNKLVKGCLGTNNVESSARLCWASGVVGLVKAFGADAPPCAYEDIEHADCFFLAGYNLAASKPVIFKRLMDAKAKRKAPLVVVDPRRTTTAARADLHLPIRPGTDVALHNALARVLIEEKLIDESQARRLTANYDALKAHVLAEPLDDAARLTGLAKAEIVKAARLIGRAKATLFAWGQGLNQSSIGTRKVTSLLNLVFITGNLGRPGAGPLAITGQTSAMGLREVGSLPHLLPGFRSVKDPEARAEVAAIWGVDPARMSAKPGLLLNRLLEEVERGKVKVLWVIHANPAATFPDSRWAEKALSKAELLIVQDCYHPTETSRLAHLLLPGATWAEKAGSMTNSERGLNVVERAVNPPGEARTDLQIAIDMAKKLGHGRQFAYPNEEAIFEEYKRCTKGRPCDISGLSYARIRKEKGIQWPVPTTSHPGTKRRFVDLKFPQGKLKLNLHQHQEPVERTDAAYPLLLITGLLPMQFHSRTRTGKIPALRRAAPEPVLEIHPADAKKLRVKHGARVAITSRRGRVTARARVTQTIRLGAVFLPYHFGQLAGKGRAVNSLTNRAFDEYAKQPEFKACAVKVAPA